ncbi:MAG: hypothetical protein QXU32_00260 [Nitrososphaerales archaeon]
MSEESESKVSNKFQPSDMIKSLDSLVQEVLQIYEFNTEEQDSIEKICETIGMILTQLKTTVKVSTLLLGPKDDVKKAVLLQDGRIMITYNDDEVVYKKLADLRSGTLMLILNDVFPKLKDAMSAYKKVLEERLSVYREANKKMKKIEQVFKEEQKPSMEDVIDEGVEPNLAKLR